MLSTFKKILFLLLILNAHFFAFAQSKSASLFVSVYSDSNFFSNEDVLKAYVGSWSGKQIVKFGENQMAGKIDITYSPMFDERGLRLVGVGKITAQNGRSIPTTSYMYVADSRLILEMRTERGAVFFYKGIIDAKSVIWVPIYDFFLYDFQQDFFYQEKDKQMINAVGFRYFSYQGGSGILEVRSQFERLRESYPASEVRKDIKKNINVRLDGGVKFGK